MAEEAPELDLACSTGIRIVSQLRAGAEWGKTPCILGIDEAGRGPVLGPMVYTAAFCAADTDITKRGYNDSKALSADSRDRLFRAINSDGGMGWVAHIMSAQHISSSMLGRDKVSLNALAVDATCHVIRVALESGANVKQVYVDTVGDADRHRDRLARVFPGLEFTVCPKADALFPIVSAASIVAKVVRDRALEQTAKSLGLTGELGSGYPGDPATAAWLTAHMHPVWGFPALVRLSWETCARMLEPPEALSVKFEADEDADGGQGGGAGCGAQQQRLNFGRAGGAALLESSGLGRHTYFRLRKLQRVAEAF